MQRLLTPRMVAPPLTIEVLEGIEAFVHTERFLTKLQQARHELDDADEQHTNHLQQLAAPARAESFPVVEDVSDEEWSDCRAASTPAVGSEGLELCSLPTDATAAPSSSSTAAAAAPAAPTADGFVVIDLQDAVEGMAYYIALYISAMPEARKMEPKQLQYALKEAFKVVRRSKFKMVWEWGRWVYRWSAFSYGMVSLYDNPWLLRALLAGIWTAAKAARFAMGHLL